MGVALGRVEHEVADARARDVQVLGRDVGEEDAGGDVRASPLARGREQVALAQVREAEEPEDALGDAGEDAEPGAEGCWLDLPAVSTRHRDSWEENVPCRAD